MGIATLAVLSIGGVAVQQRQVDDEPARLFDWQISAFYDMNASDQAIYNALSTAATELWWIHGDLLYYSEPERASDPWPTVQELDEEYVLPPFTKDIAWSRHGELQWQRVASFSFEGSAVYHGSGGSVPGQSAYLVMLSHVHKGASYADGATIWIHPDPNAAAPQTIKRDSLIVNGWKEVVPYSGAMEVERLRGA
jgi:hypothetical protein